MRPFLFCFFFTQKHAAMNGIWTRSPVIKEGM